ncbi:MAG TPA: hypothetical protein VGR07_10050 [Thermoanaerobaculia bacterium]|jgi:hypothetical protein|nr:hypothetical protein [Thermoanaerobaculia bacterium]
MAPDNEQELRAASDRIEVLMGELAAASPAIQAKTEELVRLLMQLYGGGLKRILAIVDEAGAADPIFARLVADDLVSTLLVLHDLHPELSPKLVQIGGNGGAPSKRRESATRGAA